MWTRVPWRREINSWRTHQNTSAASVKQFLNLRNCFYNIILIEDLQYLWNTAYNIMVGFGLPVFYLFGPSVSFSALQFSIYSAL